MCQLTTRVNFSKRKTPRDNRNNPNHRKSRILSNKAQWLWPRLPALVVEALQRRGRGFLKFKERLSASQD